MILNYFQSNNFGDALNPYIFHHFLPDFFDSDPETSFVGIGSILGLKNVREAKKKIVFSSGFAYGEIPKIDDSFDIFCVRGPLTCEALKIDKKFAISDGAILIQYMEQEMLDKKYKYAYMPHWESMQKYNWKIICEMSNVHLINPTDDIQSIITQIKQTEVLIAEAMHGAVVADTLRVPWIPAKAYAGINDLKWQDWASTFKLDYDPFKISSLYDDTSFTRNVIREKTGYPLPLSSLSPIIGIFKKYQNRSILPKVVKEFQMIKSMDPYLSKESILKSKGEQLLDKLDDVKKKYSVNN
jgi:succinoglycan biosynthesis protein ExoV